MDKEMFLTLRKMIHDDAMGKLGKICVSFMNANKIAKTGDIIDDGCIRIKVEYCKYNYTELNEIKYIPNFMYVGTRHTKRNIPFKSLERAVIEERHIKTINGFKIEDIKK